MSGWPVVWRRVSYILIGILIIVVLQSLGALVLPTELDQAGVSPTPTPTPAPTLAPTASATPSVMPTPPTPSPTSANSAPATSSQWPKTVNNPLAIDVVVNKKYKLPSSFVPPDLRTVNVAHTNNHPLRAQAASALEQMVAGASSQGVNLRLLSGYRSYSMQSSLYNNYVQQYGQAEADTFSARPGHSEHQLGLVLDIGDVNATGCDIAACFGATAGGKWVAAHAAEYGYIIRYTAAKQSVTGYMAEPWHIRYVGVALAQQLASSGLTLEEHFDIPGGSY